MRLGKKNPLQDHRTLKLTTYLKDMPKAPDSVDVGKPITDWGMLRNNQLGDCTCAGIGHMFRVWDYQTKDPERANDDDTVDLYSRVTQPPFDPRTGANDDGAVELFVLREVRKNGMKATGAAPSSSGGDAMKIIAFAQVDPKNQEMVKLATFLFSGLYLGVALPVSASRQQSAGQPWDDTGDTGPDGQPGGWGGHAVNVVGYDQTYVYFVTWGAVERMTWRFFERYVEEAWALIPDDYQKLPQGQALENGFRFDDLMEDLKQFGKVNPDAA